MTFVLWGALHGVYIILHQFWLNLRGRRTEPTLYHLLPAWFLTQAAVGLSRILFRSADLSTASIYFKGLLRSSGTETMEAPPCLDGNCFFVVDHVAGWMVQRNPDLKQRIPVSLQAMTYAAMIVFLFQVRLETVHPFIYFKF